MPHFTMNRDLSLNSLQGASINFKANEPEFAPEFLRAEIEDKGGQEVADPEGGEAPFPIKGEEGLFDAPESRSPVSQFSPGN